MKSDITAYPGFLAAIQKGELVYLFGAGISSALTDNLIQIVCDILTQAKAEGTYHIWVRASFEGALEVM